MASLSRTRKWLNSKVDWLCRDGLALLVFLVAGCVAIYPLLFAMDTLVLGWAGDNIQYVYMIGRIAEALRTFQSPLVDPQLNYPGSLALAATDAPFLMMIAVSPAVWIANPVFAYNLLIFLSYFFSGYFTYLWFCRLTGNRFGGLVAGLIFLLLPFRVVHSYGHLQLVTTLFIPLFFWSLDDLLISEIPTLKNLGLVAGATFLAGSGMGQYYLVICLISGFIYIVLFKPSINYLKSSGWKILVAAGLGAITSALPYLALTGDELATPFKIADTRIWSASLVDFIAPSRLHPIWGHVIDRVYPRLAWIEHTVYLGIFQILLAIVGLIWAERVYYRRNLVWIGVALTGLILALGTDLRISMGVPLQAQHPIWLPAYYFGQLPYLGLMRVWARFAIVPMFFTAMLAGIGALSLLRKFNLGKAGMFVVLALVCIDFAPGRLTNVLLKPRAIDIWLAEQPGDYAIAFLPPGVEVYEAMYGSLIHNKKMPAFNHPNHLPTEFRQFQSKATGVPGIHALRKLKNMQLRLIIFYRPMYDGQSRPEWSLMRNSLLGTGMVRELTEVDEFSIFEFSQLP